MDFKYKKKYQAENGEDGRKKKQYGKSGKDLVIKVPMGTMVFDEESGKLLGDLPGIAAHILRKCGVSDIRDTGCCTWSDPKRFFSYRRDGCTGRLAGIIVRS